MTLVEDLRSTKVGQEIHESTEATEKLFRLTNELDVVADRLRVQGASEEHIKHVLLNLEFRQVMRAVDPECDAISLPLAGLFDDGD